MPLPSGLRGFADLDGRDNRGLPSGLADFAAVSPQQGYLNEIQQALQGIEQFQLGAPNMPTYSNEIEQFLNENLGGDTGIPQPDFRIGGRIALDPEQGFVVDPLASEYDLYAPTGEDPRYGRMGPDPDRAPYQKVVEWVPLEQARDIPGFEMGENFQTEDGTWYTFDKGESGWQETGGTSGYIKPAEGRDTWSPYVDQFVYGNIPKPGSAAEQMAGHNLAQGPTEMVGSYVNPLIDTYVNYLNETMGPEQIQAAIEAGVDPLELDYSINDWNFINRLVGAGGSGLGEIPVEIQGQLDDWTRNLLSAAGMPSIEKQSLPSGLMDFI